VCRRTEGFLGQVLQRHRNHETFKLYRVCVDGRGDLVERFRIARLPTFLVINDKRVRARLEVPRGCSELQEFLAPWLK
jgi:hypothetical protein